MKKSTQLKTRVLSLAAAAVIGLSCLSGAARAAGTRFADVPQDDWSYLWVMEAVRLNLVSGTSDVTFEPEAETTVAHFATMITKAFYADELAKAEISGSWWNPFLETANSRQLLAGTAAGLAYASNGHSWTQAIAEQSLTRYEMACVIANLLADKGMTPSAEQLDAARAAIPDYAQIPVQYRDAAAACVAAGILSGKEGGLFCGEDHFTRAEMACIGVKLCNHMEETHSAGPDPVEPEGPTLANGAPITQENVREIIEGLQAEYPEGMHWTNDDYYLSQVLYRAGYGCEAFGLLCSDAAFGELPLTGQHSSFDAIRAGDLLRIYNDTHTVVVLEKRENSVIVAEGNYNSSIHWGREITLEELAEDGFTVRTRYPE